MYSPFMPTQTQIVRVNGEAGAKTLTLAPNSSMLVLDETAPLVWLCQSDGAGYKTVTPYSITEYKPAPVPTTQDLIDRITRLEERLNESHIERNESDGGN